MSNKVCCVIGYGARREPFSYRKNRDEYLALKKGLWEEMERQVVENEGCRFVSKMSIGVDQLAAEIALELKARYPNVSLEVVIPFEEQAATWDEDDRDRYYSLIEQCDKETLLSRPYVKGCGERCCRYIVDTSDVLIAVWDRRGGLIAEMVSFAMSKNKEVVVLDPRKLYAR